MNEEKLTIGFIGAGRVGCTLGRYFFEKGLKISGFFSKTYEHAEEAAAFTKSKSYKTIKELSDDSQVIFITVPDSEIYNVFLNLKDYELKNKILCHCSGSLSAQIFKGIQTAGACGYSVHPVFAINDKKLSYKEISRAFFTVEGDKEKMSEVCKILDAAGNPYQIIDAENKHKYHGALVMSSNLVIGLYHMASRLLEECGFSETISGEVLAPLFLNNAENLCRYGCSGALTGPVDRNDTETVRDHMSVIKDDTNVTAAYRALSNELIEIASKKYPGRDYTQLRKVINEEN